MSLGGVQKKGNHGFVITLWEVSSGFEPLYPVLQTDD